MSKKINIEFSKEHTFSIWQHLMERKKDLENTINSSSDDSHKVGIQLEIDKINEYIVKFDVETDEECEEEMFTIDLFDVKNMRGMTKEEAERYEKSLLSLGKPTGRNRFEIGEEEIPKYKIILQEWTYDCGEPSCCNDYGTKLIVNGEVIDKYFEQDENWLKKILEVFNIKNFEIEVISEEK